MCARKHTLVLLGAMVSGVGCHTVAEAPAGADIAPEGLVEPRTAAAAPAAPPACPEGMVLVAGEYCPNVVQTCLRWMDPPGPYEHFRCAEYQRPSRCAGPKVSMRFCIDRFERVAPGERSGESAPQNFVSFDSGAQLCARVGARLCKESEWQFACEGEEMLPYPYGYVRDAAACNTDITQNLGRTGRLVDHRAKGGQFERCKSPFGVYDLSGNLEEWVEADHPMQKGAREVMKGSWWIPSRHACRSFQIGHGASYGGGETGVRCCKAPG